MNKCVSLPKYETLELFSECRYRPMVRLKKQGFMLRCDGITSEEIRILTPITSDHSLVDSNQGTLQHKLNTKRKTSWSQS